MLTQGDTHPRLATRAYECYEFSKSDQYYGILDGSYTLDVKKEKEAEDIVEEEIVAADVSLQTSGDNNSNVNIDAELEREKKSLRDIPVKLIRMIMRLRYSAESWRELLMLYL